MKISVIVPIYNEEQKIEQFQKQLKKLTGEYEVIFVDGGSQDNTLALIDKKYKVLHSIKGRGNQLNLGIKNSTGNILFFLHCDSVLPKEPLKEIKEVMKNHYVGCFGIRFESESILMKICGYLSNARVVEKNIAFGDQGIFVSKSFFKMFIKEFRNIPIMEDFQFSLDVNKVDGVKYGLTKHKIKTSPRRYGNTAYSKLKTMYQMYNLRKEYLKGENIEIITQKYKDIS